MLFRSTRGGGSIAELSSFDNEKIAMAIAKMRVPVLSGIGHEINTTVTDLTAHTFAKTPTAIAKFLVERLEEFLKVVEERQQRLLNALEGALRLNRTKLKDNAFFLQTRTLGLIKGHHQRLASITDAIKRSPAVRFKGSRKSLAEAQEHLKKIIYLHLQSSRTKICQYQQLAHMADPHQILKRGFSITRDSQGRLLRSVKDTAHIKSMTTQLVDGVITSEIIHEKV